jgi:hypothetical protein
MRLPPATGLLLVMAAAATGQNGGTAFAPTLPHGVGDVSRWEIITGDFEAQRMRGAYRFYVNPSRQAMYQLMRYRVELLGRGGEETRGGSAERVAFVRRPATREPMLLWARSAAGVEPAWRPIGPDTDEYRVEIGVLMRVVAVHRAVRAAQAP